MTSAAGAMTSMVAPPTRRETGMENQAAGSQVWGKAEETDAASHGGCLRNRGTPGRRRPTRNWTWGSARTGRHGGGTLGTGVCGLRRRSRCRLPLGEGQPGLKEARLCKTVPRPPRATGLSRIGRSGLAPAWLASLPPARIPSPSPVSPDPNSLPGRTSQLLASHSQVLPGMTTGPTWTVKSPSRTQSPMLRRPSLPACAIRLRSDKGQSVPNSKAPLVPAGPAAGGNVRGHGHG